MDVGNLISGSSAFSNSSLNIWLFSVHVLLKPGLENFEHYFASVWDECNCVAVWAFFGIAFLWDWNGNWPFPLLWLSVRWIQFLNSLFVGLFPVSLLMANCGLPSTLRHLLLELTLGPLRLRGKSVRKACFCLDFSHFLSSIFTAFLWETLVFLFYW